MAFYVSGHSEVVLCCVLYCAPIEARTNKKNHGQTTQKKSWTHSTQHHGTHAHTKTCASEKHAHTKKIMDAQHTSWDVHTHTRTHARTHAQTKTCASEKTKNPAPSFSPRLLYAHLVCRPDNVVLPAKATSTADPKSPRRTPSQSTSPVLLLVKNTFSG